MSHRFTSFGFFASLLAMALMAMFFFGEQRLAFASAPSGLPAAQSIATTTVLGPQVNVQIFANNGTCAARVISTQTQGILLIFADPSNGDLASTTLNGGKGFWQSGSTTVAYDSGLYGCGKMFGFAAASTTITAVQTQ